MKTKIAPIIIMAMMFIGCGKPEFRWAYYGEITSFRLDDDSEYHFSTDIVVRSDIQDMRVTIYRKNIKTPILYMREFRCPDGQTCNTAGKEWAITRGAEMYKIEIPMDYKIETFDD